MVQSPLATRGILRRRESSHAFPALSPPWLPLHSEQKPTSRRGPVGPTWPVWPLPLRPQLLAISPPAPAPGTQPLTQTHFPSETFVLALPSAREVLPQHPPAPSISSLRPLVKCLLLLEAHPDHLFSHCSLTPFPSFTFLHSTCNHPIYIHISIAVCLPFKSNVSSRGQGFFVFCFFFSQSLLEKLFISIKTKSKHRNQKTPQHILDARRGDYLCSLCPSAGPGSGAQSGLRVAWFL